MPRSALTEEELTKLSATKSGKQISAIMAAIAPVIREMQNKIKELEARPTPKFVGAFAAGKAYAEMSFCVHAGSLWIAKTATVLKPGTNQDWQLVAKRGDFR